LDSIDAYTHFVTTSGSSYGLGTKKDESELLDYAHRRISNFASVLDIPEPIVKNGAYVGHKAPSPVQDGGCAIKKGGCSLMWQHTLRLISVTDHISDQT
jgi:hypothetical protein